VRVHDLSRCPLAFETMFGILRCLRFASQRRLHLRGLTSRKRDAGGNPLSLSFLECATRRTTHRTTTESSVAVNLFNNSARSLVEAGFLPPGLSGCSPREPRISLGTPVMRSTLLNALLGLSSAKSFHSRLRSECKRDLNKILTIGGDSAASGDA